MLPYGKNEANFIKFILTHPCGSDWFLFVETFAEASLFLALNLGLPTLQDILSDESRKLLASKTPHRHRFRPGELFEEGKELSPTARRTYKFAKGAAWFLSGLEFLGFWWSIFAGVDDFFYLWHSLLVERRWCEEAIETGPFRRLNDNFDENFNATHNAMNLATLVENRAGWPTTPFGVNPTIGFIQVVFCATISASAGNNLPGCFLWCRGPTPLGQSYAYSDEFEVPAGGSIDVVVQTTFIAQSPLDTNVSWGTYNPTHALGIAHVEKADVWVRLGLF